jgi:hypothetical protein
MADQLSKSLAREHELRVQLTALETDAVALRESRSTLTDAQAAEMARVRGELRLAERHTSLIRERSAATPARTRAAERKRAKDLL